MFNIDVSVKKRFLFFGRNSGIHGLGYIFKENSNDLAKLFWVIVLLASSGCLYLLLVPVAERGAEVSFTPDTRYLPWTTTFPAVTICEAYNAKNVQKKLSEHYPDLMEPLNFDFKRYLTDLLFARGTCSRSLCVPCGDQVACNLPWRDIVEDIHKSCDEMLSECSFSGEEFPCCKKFLPVDSAQGPCYSFNSLQSGSNDAEPLYFVNRSTGPGVLSFRTLTDVHISVHSTEELSTNNLDRKFKFDVKPYMENRVEFLFSMVDIENDPLLRFDEANLRGCRYYHEVPDEPFHNYPAYSYGACRLAEDTEHSFGHCSCVHPVRDKSHKDTYCNYTGLNCLVTYEDKTMTGIKIIKHGDRSIELTKKFPIHHIQKIKLGIDAHDDVDNCLPSCLESELTTIHISRGWESEEVGRGAMVNVQMASLPTLRYQRNLLRTDLDLVVTIGGMVGLFFGASILSLVEMVYLFLR